MKTALIIGCDGQDGRIAFEQLAADGYRVLGVDRGGCRAQGIEGQHSVDILDPQSVDRLLKTLRPDEIYYLAAYHHSSQDAAPADPFLFEKSHEINVRGLMNFLESIRVNNLPVRLFYAASSLLFGNAAGEVQDEQTVFAPDTIYGISKLGGLMLCRYYRNRYGVFASSGIFYNHESPYRTESFISKKIIKAAVKIARKEQDVLVVGDLNAEVDWGYAPDYVDAMRRILSIGSGDDFVIATGIKHSVRDFVAITFGLLGMDWEKYVRQDGSIMNRKRKAMVGNAGKLRELTGWQPTVDLKEMIRRMLQAEGAAV